MSRIAETLAAKDEALRFYADAWDGPTADQVANALAWGSDTDGMTPDEALLEDAGARARQALGEEP